MTIRSITIHVDGPRLDELLRLADASGIPFPSAEAAATTALSLGIQQQTETYRYLAETITQEALQR